MFARKMMFTISALGVAALLFPMIAVADQADRSDTRNMHLLGRSPSPVVNGRVNSDLAFWGRYAFEGHYDGFRIIDISNPWAPREVSHPSCDGDQGDIFVWDDILVRSWNTKRPEERTCDGQTVPALWEGVHVFDISDKRDPELVASVSMPCGSHTLTGAREHDRLIVYSNISNSVGCTDEHSDPHTGPLPQHDPIGEFDDHAGDFMDIIEVPLDAPQHANLLRRVPLAGPTTEVRTGCHDAGLILGEVNLLACASADTINVFDVGRNATRGGSLADPALLYTITEPGVGQAGTNGRWHSATFTWDGRVLVAGWEPGGGSAAECETADPDVDKSAFFYDARTGAKLGQWTLPRGQDGAPDVAENCTIHNYNVVAVGRGRYVLVSGNYQAGTWVTEFTNPARPRALGWSDPPVIVPTTVGGAWSSYWYNNLIYQSAMTEGLSVLWFSGSATAGAIWLHHLNPQTQEFSLR
jgi:LVIVD repeat